VEWKQKFFRWWCVFERTGLWLSRRQRLQLRVARWRMAAATHARYQQECIHRASRAAAASKIQAFLQGHTVRKLIGPLQRERARAASSCPHELCICYGCSGRASAKRTAEWKQKFHRWWYVWESTGLRIRYRESRGLWLYNSEKLQIRIARWRMAVQGRERVEQAQDAEAKAKAAEAKAKAAEAKARWNAVCACERSLRGTFR